MVNLVKKSECVKYADLTRGTDGNGIFFVHKIAQKVDITGRKYVTFSLRTADFRLITARLFKADEWLSSLREPLSALVHRPIRICYTVQLFEGVLNLLISELQASIEIDAHMSTFIEYVQDLDQKTRELEENFKIKVNPSLARESISSLASGRQGGAIDLLYRVMTIMKDEDILAKDIALKAHKYVVTWLSWISRGETRLMIASIEFLSDIAKKDGRLVAEAVASILKIIPAHTIINHKVTNAYNFVLQMYELDDLEKTLIEGETITINGNTYTGIDYQTL